MVHALLLVRRFRLKDLCDGRVRLRSHVEATHVRVDLRSLQVTVDGSLKHTSFATFTIIASTGLLR